MMIRNRTDVDDLLIKKQHYSFGVEANTKHEENNMVKQVWWGLLQEMNCAK